MIPIIIYTYNLLALCSGSPAPGMTLTFENESDVIVYALERL